MDQSSFSKRSKKRSPFPRKSLPQAGESLRDAIFEDIATNLIVSITMAVAFAIVAITEWSARFSGRMVSPWWWTLLAIGLSLLAIYHFVRIQSRLARDGLGIRGERHVGRLLEEARKYGYIPFHDIPGDNFNVDHALIGPGGVFTIETKTRTMPTGNGRPEVDYDGRQVLVDGHAPDRDPIAQAEGSARHLKQILEKMTSHTVDVRPVVLFPKWWVNEPRAEPRVLVLNDTRLFTYLKKPGKGLTPEQISLYVESLETYLTRD